MDTKKVLGISEKQRTNLDIFINFLKKTKKRKKTTTFFAL